MVPEEDVLVRFGQRVRQLRQAKSLSQEDFADLTTLDRTYVSSIERGKRNLGLRNLHLLAKALDVTMTELFDGMT